MTYFSLITEIVLRTFFFKVEWMVLFKVLKKIHIFHIVKKVYLQSSSCTKQGDTFCWLHKLTVERYTVVLIKHGRLCRSAVYIKGL